MAEPRTYVFMSEFTDAVSSASKLVAILGKPPHPQSLVAMAQGLMRPRWHFGKDGREVRSAVIRNVKDEVVRSESWWSFVQAGTVEELQRMGCDRMVRCAPKWGVAMWLGIRKLDLLSRRHGGAIQSR
jgi:transcriptional regulator of nitric oxide reductase